MLNVEIQRERERRTECERTRKRLPYRGRWKTKEERGGVGGRERQHCLIPLQGFKRAVCVYTANGIFNNP